MITEFQAQQINISPIMLYLTCAGGGQSFFHQFMQYGGSSKTIIGGNIPYAKEAFDEFVEKPVDKYVSDKTALLLATQSFKKARTYRSDMDLNQLIGIGVTCSLATNNERAGRQNKAIIGFHSYNYSISVEIQFNQHDREQQEDLITSLIINMLLDIKSDCHVRQDWSIKLIPGLTDVVTQEIRDSNKREYQNELCSIIIRYMSMSYFKVDQLKLTHSYLNDLVVYPGSWNPLHEGHLDIINTTKQILQVPVYLELSVDNADKGMLSYFEVFARHDRAINMIVTHAPTFVDKVKFFAKEGQRLIFVVGADTWLRIQDPKYAGDIDELYDVFKFNNVKFLVFARNGIEIKTNTKMDELLIESDIAWNFNKDISSTELRVKYNLT